MPGAGKSETVHCVDAIYIPQICCPAFPEGAFWFRQKASSDSRKTAGRPGPLRSAVGPKRASTRVSVHTGTLRRARGGTFHLTARMEPRRPPPATACPYLNHCNPPQGGEINAEIVHRRAGACSRRPAKSVPFFPRKPVGDGVLDVPCDL